jgi:hypothetical protein
LVIVLLLSFLRASRWLPQILWASGQLEVLAPADIEQFCDVLDGNHASVQQDAVAMALSDLAG